MHWIAFRRETPQPASYPFKNHAMSQPCNNPSLHVQKGRNFLCKNRLKIWCSNYIKKFVEMSCFFNAYKRLSLKSYAKESSQYGAISHVFNFRKPPAVFAIHTIFAVLKIGMERNCLQEICPILISLFLLNFSENVI